jgi:hypothetical protein
MPLSKKLAAEFIGTLYGAPGRGRTGMTLRSTDFLTHDGFRRSA